MSGLSELDLPALVASGATFIEVLDRAKEASGGSLSPLAFLHAVQTQLGISFVETRNMFEYFDSSWVPLAEPEAIEGRWQEILKAHGRQGPR